MLGKPYIWVNYNDLTATSLEIIVSKGNHPKMALFQVSEILWNIIIYIHIIIYNHSAAQYWSKDLEDNGYTEENGDLILLFMG